MRLISREIIVGVLFGFSVALAGCQAVQPIGETPPIADAVTVTVDVTEEPVAESEVVEATNTPAGEVSDGEGIAGGDEVTDSVISGTVMSDTVERGSDDDAAQVVDADEEPDAALLEAGLAAYRAQYCGVCHLLDAAETRGTFGPTHNDLRATVEAYFADGIYSGNAANPAEYVRESIVDPQAFIVPGFATTSHRMPTYAHLDGATVDALVAFLLAQ